MNHPGITRIYTQHWLELPQEVRHHLVKVFGIQRTGITEVRDQTVISDGFTNEDLKVITAEKLANYVGSDGDFPHLWKVALSKVNFELHPPLEIKTRKQETHEQNKEEITDKEDSQLEETQGETDSGRDVGSDSLPTEGQPPEGGSEGVLS